MNVRHLVVLLLASPALIVAAEPAITMKRGQGTVDFLAGEVLVARYHHGAEVAKPYFWPMATPGGVHVTRAWPMEKGAPKETTDHVHQKSAWFCHGDVIPEGIELTARIKGVTGVDYWSENKGHGKIVTTGIEEGKDGALMTRNEWRTSDGQKILDEKRTIVVRKAAKGFLVIVETELTANVCPITFGDTKEGSFGVRVSDQLRLTAGNPKSQMVNSAGQSGEKACWGHFADWCDYSGEVDGKIAGIAVFDDPANKHRACWHARGYGLMAANPFGRAHAGFPGRKGQTELVKLAKGEILKLRYGIYLHDGDVKDGQVAEAFALFAGK